MQSQPDRISYSYGLKLPGAEEFSSINVNLSISSDVRQGETADQAMARARDFVHTQCEKDLNDIIKLRGIGRDGEAKGEEDEGFAEKRERKKGKKA